MVIKFFLEFLKFEFTLGFHKNIKKKKKIFYVDSEKLFCIRVAENSYGGKSKILQ